VNPEVKAKWVAALRSGEYEQGSGVLNKDGKLCCLGVLCELAIKDGVPISKTEHYENLVAYNGYETSLPVAVMEWAGMTSENPKTNRMGTYRCTSLVGEETYNALRISLAEFNDGSSMLSENVEPHNFSQIADIIEEDF
jgi:hypothetical protein